MYKVACIWFSAALVLFCASAFADNIELTYRFDAPLVLTNPDGTVSVEQALTQKHLVTGEPALPMRTAKVLIPYGHKVTGVDVVANYWLNVADGVTVEYGTRVRTLCGDQGIDYLPAARPNPEIYGSIDPFPASLQDRRSMQYKRGAQILPVNLHPVIFEPATGTVRYAPELRLIVRTEPVDYRPAGMLAYRGLPADRAEIARLVDNPEALIAYEQFAADTLEQVDYLMITPQVLQTSVQAYADYKAAAFGITVTVVTLEWIESNCTGVDLQEKIRNHITDLFQNSSLQYVLLVGDSDGPDKQILPVRNLFVSGTDPDGWVYFEDSAMASDLYYGCLDGNYNNDGDGFFGETTDGIGGGDVDLLYDVHVGRFPVENEAELANMINKTMAFENAEAPYKALFVGEILDSQTTGGDHKDVVYQFTPEVPVTTLYQRDGTYGYFGLVQAINSNEHQWLNHVGHANVTFNMEFYSGEVSALHNTAYYLGFTHGCFCGSLDSKNSYGSYSSSDCVIEWFTAKHSAGAFAYIANTRYGFYLQGRTDGPANVYDWEFADAMFNEDIAPVGAALDDAREDCIGMLDPMNMMRWQMYELLLFGDPQTPMQFDCDEDSDSVESIRCGGADCDDHDASVYPGAEELCDGLDNDCDGQPNQDEVDGDEDGFFICDNDCNDFDAAVNPDAVEDCADGVDNDCNGLTDLDDPACTSGDDDDDDDDDDDNGNDDDDDDDDDNGCGL